MPKLDLNDRFMEALRLMENTDRCLFVTGKAGTGKSTLLEYFCAHTDKKPVILAPTGVAALNVKGQTIHSFFHFYVDVTPQKIREKKIKPRSPKLYKKLKTIIIDEVSMVRADLLDCVDVFLQMHGPKPRQPFGGVQMIFIGDLYQLPPVVTSSEQNIFKTVYKTPFFFSVPAVEKTGLEIIELEKVYRQKDAKFIALLNRIRNNSVEDEDLAFLNSRYGKELGKQPNTASIRLTTTNQKADAINEAHLAGLKGKTYQFKADVRGDFTKEYFPTATDLAFKIGAQIMMLNNDSEKRWVNGSIGVIKSVKTNEDDEPYLRVWLQDDKTTVEVYPYTWEVYRSAVEGDMLISKPVGTFTQFPFRLAWAITIHKSQGKTFDHVSIDMGNGAFAAGQTYVALSRCRSFEGIVLQTPITKGNIRTDYRIFSFLTGYQYKQAETALPVDDKIGLIQKAIRENKLLEIVYLKANDTKSKRIVKPLSVGEETYSGKKFMGMKAFCMLRHEERMFSVNRVLSLTVAKS
jgi:ATP-dependent DNA helicase PIF1